MGLVIAIPIEAVAGFSLLEPPAALSLGGLRYILSQTRVFSLPRQNQENLPRVKAFPTVRESFLSHGMNVGAACYRYHPDTGSFHLQNGNFGPIEHYSRPRLSQRLRRRASERNQNYAFQFLMRRSLSAQVPPCIMVRGFLGQVSDRENT